MDIGSNSIKLIQVKRKKEDLEIKNAVSSNIESNPTDSLKELINSVKLESKEVNIGVCGQGVVIRYIQLPSMTDEELSSAIKFEAEKHIPFPIAEIYLDAKILKKEHKDNKMLVLLAAARKELLQGRLSILKGAGLEAAVVDINSLAIINAFNFSSPRDSKDKEDKSQPVSLLNIEGNLANLNILEGQLPVFSRDIILGDKGVSLKHSESSLINLANEIRLSFDFYESQGNTPITITFLSGSIQNIKGLDNFLNQNLGTEVKIWNPIHKLTFSPDIDTGSLKGKQPEFAVALGLALR